jgi:FHA domain
MKPNSLLMRVMLVCGIALELMLSISSRVLPGAAQASNTYYISTVDSSKFPLVQFRLRALDLNNIAIGNLTPANLPVFENGKPVPAKDVQVTSHTDGPLTIVFVVDLGAQSNYAANIGALRQAIARLVDGGYFVDGRDTVKLVVRDNPGSGDRTTTKLAPTSHGRELVDFVTNYSFPRSPGRTKGLKAIDDAISAMSQLVAEPGTQDAAIIFIDRAIEDPQANVAVTAAQNSASDAKSNFITVHAIQADATLPDQQPLQVVAQGANGKFVKLLSSAAGAAVDGIYQALSAQRQYYTVSYVSPSGASGSREITVGSPEKPSVGKTGNYGVNVAPPLVTLTPQTTFLRRSPIAGATTGQNPYGPLSVRATVNISWTDGITRAIQEIELDVNGVKKDSKTAAQLPAGTTSLEMVADLSDITNVGTNVATLSVRVLDALGTEATAQEQVTVEVAAAPTPTPAPPPATPVDSTVVILLAVLVVLFILIIVVAIVLLRRGKTGAAAGRNGSSAKAPPSVAPLATLIVEQGPAAVLHQPIAITRPRTVLGRDPTQCDVTFYKGEQSSVSGVHAVIESSQGFSITDNGSTNGTRVNGKKLSVGIAQPVRDGDEIILGDLLNRGVKLRFAAGKGARWERDDRTQVRM